MKIIAALVVAWICVHPAVASAQGDPLAAWVTDARYAAIRALATDYRIVLIPGEGDAAWTSQDISSLRAGASAVPPAMREGLPADVRIKRVAHQCLFGVGRFTEHCPTYDDDGNFLLYDMPPIQGEGPVERLAPLNASERADIQRRRAAVHAIALAWDAEHAWSKRKQWRRISGWRTAHQPFNRDLHGYSRYLGYRSAKLDFVTFLEEWLVRPADVIAAQRKQALNPNQSVACQEFTKGRLISKWLTLLDPTWHPASRTNRPVAKQCPAFEEWARTHELESIDLLIAAASADRPESLYGHLLMHVRYADLAEGFEPVYQFGAVTGTHVAPLTYLSRGLLGGFLSVIEVNTFRGADRLFLQYEQRNLKRYEVRLSAAQRRRVLERIWEFERHVRFPYHFFPNNCASFVYDLLVPALDLELPKRSRLIVAPTDVLDSLASVDNPGYGPLLRKRADTELSSRERAQRAVKSRRKHLRELEHAIGSKDLRTLDRELDSRDPARRQVAYERLRESLLRDLKTRGNPRSVRLAIDYLHASGEIERYFAENAFFRTREVKASAVRRPLRLSADELLQRRRQLYRSEDLQARHEQLLEWTQTNEKRLADGPFRQFTPRESKVLAHAERTEKAYIAALDAQAAVIEALDPNFDGVGYLADREAAVQREQRRRDRYATGPSGKGRISLGASGVSNDLERVGGVVDASYAFIFERLGEQRRRGFRSDIETRALGLKLHVPLSETFYDELDADVTLLRFMTIEQRLGPTKRSFLSNLGWGADVFGGHDGRRELRIEGGVAGGVLIPIFQFDEAADHLVLGAWADARIHFGNEGRRILTGADAFARLLVHLGGVYANSLRLQGHTTHWVALETATYEWEHRVRLSTEHAIAFVGQHPLVLSPWASLQWTSVDYGGRDEHRDARAGLALELPL